MPHNLCLEYGKAKLFYHGEAPWHRLGTRLEGPATSKAAIEAAGLDWTVEKVPLHMHVLDKSILIPDHFAVVRSDLLTSQGTAPALGLVGRGYTPVQNRDAFAFFDDLVGGPDKAIYHTAGALGAGERIWILAKLPGEIRIGRTDVTEKFLLLSSSHDGQSSVQFKFTPIRVVCQNTLVMALSEGSALRIPHRSQAWERLRWTARTLGAIQGHFLDLGVCFNRMGKKALNERAFTLFLDKVLPLPEEPGANERFEPDLAGEQRAGRQNRILVQRTAVRLLWEEGQGSDILDIRHTLWAAYNAVTEMVDHFSKRKTLPPGDVDSHVESAWFGEGHRLKAKAYRAAIEMLGVAA